MKGNKRRKLDEAVQRQFEPQSRGRSTKDGKDPCQPITTPAFQRQRGERRRRAGGGGGVRPDHQSRRPGPPPAGQRPLLPAACLVGRGPRGSGPILAGDTTTGVCLMAN